MPGEEVGSRFKYIGQGKPLWSDIWNLWNDEGSYPKKGEECLG